MKRNSVLILLLSIVFVLCGCRSAEKSNNLVLNDYGLRHSGYYGLVAADENNLYISAVDYMWVYDLTNNQLIPLCNKPNCLHDKETIQQIGQTCNAYLENASYGGFLLSREIFCWDDHLYMYQWDYDFDNGIVTSTSLVKIEKDGSKREKVLTFKDTSPASIVYYDNIIYYISSSLTIESVDLINGNNMCLINKEGTIESPASLLVYNGEIYFLAQRVIKENGSEYFGALVKYSPITHSIDVVADNIVFTGNPYLNVISDDQLVMSNDNNLYLIDIRNSECKLFLENTDALYPTEDYYYTYNGNSFVNGKADHKIVSVYNKQFELIDKIEVSKTMYVRAIGGHNNKFYLAEYIGEKLTIFEFYVKNGKIKYDMFLTYDPANSLINGYGYYR